MERWNNFSVFFLLAVALLTFSCNLTEGEIKLRDKLLEKDKKSMVTKKLKKASAESIKQFIKEIDSTGVIRKIIRRKIHIPKDSSLTLTSQVSRPNIFPNIFNQGDGFIVDAVVEWPIWLDLHAFTEAMHGNPTHHDGGWTSGGGDGGGGGGGFVGPDLPIVGGSVFKTELGDVTKGNGEGDSSDDEDDDDDIPFIGPTILGGDEEDDEEAKGRSLPMSGFIGLERCHIYEKIETGMTLYLSITRNQSHDCVLRAICEAQLLADFYLDAPSSIFFEVIHLILKPSLGVKDACFEKYLVAEKAAYQAPEHCSKFVAKCPLNIAGLFVRNFFPEIL